MGYESVSTTKGGFKWVSPDTNYDVPDDSKIGYILEVDLEYPSYLHDKHNDNTASKEKLNYPLHCRPNEEKHYLHFWRYLYQCIRNQLRNRSVQIFFSKFLIIAKIAKHIYEF